MRYFHFALVLASVSAAGMGHAAQAAQTDGEQQSPLADNPDDPVAAEKIARAMLELTATDSLEYAIQLARIGRALHLQSRFAEAEPVLRSALDALGALPVAPDSLLYAQFRFYLAESLRVQNLFEDAEQFARMAWNARVGAAPLERADSTMQLATVLLALERWGEAADFAMSAQDLRTSVLGAEHPRTVNAIIALAKARAGQNRLDEADTLFQRALELRRKGKDPDEKLIDDASDYGWFLYRQKRYADAVAVRREVLALAREKMANDPQYVAYSASELAEAIWFADDGGEDEAERLLTEALGILDRGDLASASDLFDQLKLLANLASRARRYGEAEVIYRRLIAAEGARGNGEAPWLTHILGELAHVLMAQDDGQTFAENPNHPEARRLLERQILLIEESEGPTARELALPLQRLAIILRWQRDPAADAVAQRALSVIPDAPSLERVKALYESAANLDTPEQIARTEEARAMLIAIGGEDDGFLFVIDERLAQLSIAVGNLGHAESIMDNILSRRIANGDTRGTGRAQILLSIVLLARGKDDLAAAYATDSLRLLAQLDDAESIDAGLSMDTLAGVARNSGDFGEAEKLTRAALAIYEARLPGGYARQIAASLTSLGLILIELGNPDEAIGFLSRAAEIHARWFGPASLDVGYANIARARAYAAAKRIDEARALFASSYRILAEGTAVSPGSTLLIEPSRDYARFALADLASPALARTLLRKVQPIILERAARVGVDADAARELRTNRSSLTLAVQVDWQLANPG